MNRRPSPAGSTGQKNPGRTRSTSCRIANSIDGVRSPRLCERHSEIDSALSRPLALTRLTPLLVSHPHRNARYEILPKSAGANIGLKTVVADCQVGRLTTDTGAPLLREVHDRPGRFGARSRPGAFPARRSPTCGVRRLTWNSEVRMRDDHM